MRPYAGKVAYYTFCFLLSLMPIHDFSGNDDDVDIGSDLELSLLPAAS